LRTSAGISTLSAAHFTSDDDDDDGNVLLQLLLMLTLTQLSEFAATSCDNNNSVRQVSDKTAR